MRVLVCCLLFFSANFRIYDFLFGLYLCWQFVVVLSNQRMAKQLSLKFIRFSAFHLSPYRLESWVTCLGLLSENLLSVTTNSKSLKMLRVSCCTVSSSLVEIYGLLMWQILPIPILLPLLCRWLCYCCYMDIISYAPRA